MRSRSFGTVLAVVVALVALDAAAQDAYGTWYNAQYNATMVLNQDGTYTFNGPYGASAGTWGVQGTTFGMQDASGQTIYYTVTGFDGSVMQLLDGAGNTLQYVKQTGNAPAAGGGASAITGGSVLATAQGLQLTTAHIQVGVGLIQFIIGGAIKQSEVDELTQQSIKEFQLEPKTFLSEVEGIAGALGQLQTLTDATKIGMARMMLFAELYKATKDLKESDKPLLVQIMHRYINVLAYDAANGLLLTDKDADAVIAYMELTNQASGITQTMTAAQKTQFKSDLVKEFSKMSLEQKQFICTASLTWGLVEANLAKLSQAQQQALMQSYAAQPAAPAPSYGGTTGGTYSGTAGGGAQPSGKKSIADMQSEMWAKQNMFDMMNNMSLQNHATMLNTIENFGGTGNYWEVTPSY